LQRAFLTTVRLHRTIEAEEAALPVGPAPAATTFGSLVMPLASREAPLGKVSTVAERGAVRY
jgi:hypothetical protein